jgi:hypothetical protein
MTAWEKLRQTNKRTKPFIDVGLHWANIYYNRMDNTRAYVIAMCKSSHVFWHARSLIADIMRFSGRSVATV